MQSKLILSKFDGSIKQQTQQLERLKSRRTIVVHKFINSFIPPTINQLDTDFLISVEEDTGDIIANIT